MQKYWARDTIAVHMKHWLAAHRAFAIETFFKNGDSVVVTQRLCRRHFNIGRHGRIPERHTITNWVNKFHTTSSALDRKPGGSVKSMWTPENIEHVRNAVNRSPRRLVRKHASAPALSRSSTSQILHLDLHYHLYKIQVVQELSKQDFIARKAFCKQFFTLVQEEPNVIR
jgi:hypothetical protein